jgi:DNA-binding transcriptional LysR family regulator
VQAGLGLGLLSRATIEQELELKRLVELDVAEFPIMRHWYMVHRRGKRLSTVAEVFKDFIVKDARALISGVTSPSGSPGQRRQRR